MAKTLTRSVELEPIDRLEEKIKLLVGMVDHGARPAPLASCGDPAGALSADIACWAEVTWPCADAAAAVSAASCVEVVELSALSAATLACAVARVAWA